VRSTPWDAIVVGAGPAGSSAALDLAQSRARVLLVDRREFPRDKPCGGALTAKAWRAITVDLGAVIRHRTRHLVAGRLLERGRETLALSRAPTVAMTLRSELDEALRRAALAAGAEYRRIEALTAIETRDGAVVARTPGGDLEAAALIGADGANSTVRRILSGGDDHLLGRGFAIEARVGRPAPDDRVWFDFGVCALGYGWAFPKGDHWNVGLYSADARFVPGETQLRRYASARLGTTEITDLKGAPLTFGGHRSTSAPRVLLAGDAGGFAEITLGEGIYYAVSTGRLAARAILESRPDGAAPGPIYDRLLAPVRRDLATAERLGMKFHRNVGLGYRVLLAAPIRHLLIKAFALGVPQGEMWWRLPSIARAPWPRA
jgi:geranylgeranyl reductase family protein